ncbi:uncharacterized protein LOC128500145 isoform X2 [Spea bombifrons]|uniref:uncharacterized protein LOC128500145 isoform X2 n=1 Tax=Spea bombifrons TaxID=233779 RepID=UPI00234A05E5|nr:uncharacterized protein LOC128500145 isoform X2 [Spea bombifrons]
MKTRGIWFSLLVSSCLWSINGGHVEENIVDPTDMENYDPVSKTMKTKHKSPSAILKNYLQKMLDEVQKLGIIDDNHEEHRFSADIVLTRQTLVEISKFLNNEDWDPVALESSLQSIFSQFKHRDDYVKEQSEDGFWIALHIIFLVIIYFVLLMHPIDWLQQLNFFNHLSCVIIILLARCQNPWNSFFEVFPFPAHQNNQLKQNKDLLHIYFMDLMQLSLSTVLISFVLKICYWFGKWIIQLIPLPKREHPIHDAIEKKEEPGVDQGLICEGQMKSEQQSSSSEIPQFLQPSKDSKQNTLMKDKTYSTDEFLHISPSTLQCQRKDKLSSSTQEVEEKVLAPEEKTVVEDISPAAVTDTPKDHDPSELAIYTNFSTLQFQEFLFLDQDDIDIYTDNALLNSDDSGSQSIEVIEDPL